MREAAFTGLEQVVEALQSLDAMGAVSRCLGGFAVGPQVLRSHPINSPESERIESTGHVEIWKPPLIRSVLSNRPRNDGSPGTFARAK